MLASFVADIPADHLNLTPIASPRLCIKRDIGDTSIKIAGRSHLNDAHFPVGVGQDLVKLG